MEPMETMVEALERLRAEGYEADYTITEEGRVRSADRDWQPDQITIDHIVRFEGMSNPSDEAMLLAVTGPDGTRGTLSVPYGPEASGPQIDAIRALLIAHNHDQTISAPDR